MLHAIHFFVILRMLVIVVGLESQFGLTYTATEASTMEEGEIFEGADFISGIDRFAASKAARILLVASGAEHFLLLSSSIHF